MPKLVEIAKTRSLRRRTGWPVPVENSSGSGSVANRSKKAEAMNLSRRSRRAFSTTTMPASGAVLSAPTKSMFQGPIRALVRNGHGPCQSSRESQVVSLPAWDFVAVARIIGLPPGTVVAKHDRSTPPPRRWCGQRSIPTPSHLRRR